MPNYHAKTGIPFGMIRASALHSEVLDDLTIFGGTNETYERCKAEYLAEARADFEAGNETFQDEDGDFDESAAEDAFSNTYQADEEIYSGVRDGVTYQTTWMGGAQNVWIFESPVIVKCRVCSPCVPGAGDLDGVGSYEAYGVPVEWLDPEFVRELCERAGYMLMRSVRGYRWSTPDEAQTGEWFVHEDAAWADCYNKNIVVKQAV